MARTFVRASTQYLRVTSTPVTAPPFTIACWIKTSNVTDLQFIGGIGDKDAAQHWFRLVADGSAAEEIRFDVRAGGTIERATASASYSAGVPAHVCAVASGTAGRTVYINGGNAGTNNVSRTPLGLDNITIAKLPNNAVANTFDGDISEFAIWNVALTAAEVRSLAEGFSPDQIRRGNLVFYDRMIRDADRDIVGGLILTPFNGPTIGTHPRMIYPSAPSFSPALAAGSGIRWNDRGGITLQTNANWGGTHFFEATLRATMGTVYARLIKASDRSAVADSEISTSSSTRTRVRSAAITLTDGAEYVAQTGWVPGLDQGFANRPTIITI